MPTAYNSRPYDIVLFGATGVTGYHTAEYLLNKGDKTIKWAIGGRSLAKLEKVKEKLIALDEYAKTLDILIADTSDPNSLDKLLAKTRVVINLVGPFTKYGTPVVEACLRQKTHYVDITGEYNWIRQIILHFHEKAEAENVIIVPACGFDSIPSDLGTFMVVDHLKKQHGLATESVKMSVIDILGCLSGGTIHSCLIAMTDDTITGPDSVDPYLLSSTRGLTKPSLPWPHRDRDFHGLWQAFFIMSAVNEKIVLRSWDIQHKRGKDYGRLFTYHESQSMPFIQAILFSIAFFVFLPMISVLSKNKFCLKKIQQLLPESGIGPTDEEIAKGYSSMEFLATAETQPYDDPVQVRGIVKGFGDPGYSETCRMASESALSIIKSLDTLPGKEGGVLTPATAFGNVLLDRLRADNGMIFEVEEVSNPKK
ncbi:saccharopine dehydrogenase [Phycomyces nitens]|nr:saccharopine dehydrogenase [Phycomyces nitens]